MDTLLHWAASQGLEQFALTLLQQGNTELHNHRSVMVRNDLVMMHSCWAILISYSLLKLGCCSKGDTY